MSEKLKECIPYLQVLMSTKDPRSRRRFFQLFHHCIVTAVREISVNLLKGHIDLSSIEKAKLGKYKEALRKLAQPHPAKSAERDQLLLRKGKKILTELLPPVVRRLKHV